MGRTDSITLTGDAAAILTGSEARGDGTDHAFEVVLADDPAAATALDARLAEAEDARIVRIGNRLRSPLSLTRVLTQIGYQLPDETDTEGPDRDEAGVVAALFASRGDEHRVILVVEQAQSLTEEACRFLWQLAGVQDTGRLPLQVICMGDASLRQTLQAALGADIARQLDAPPAATARPVDGAAGSAEAAPRARRSWRWVVPVVASLAIASVWLSESRVAERTREPAKPAEDAGTQTAIAVPAASDAPVAAEPPPAPADRELNAVPEAMASQPAPAAPPVSAPDLGPSAETLPQTAQFGPIEPPGMEIARLHREFDAFLSDAGDVPVPLTPSQRERLFQDYLLSRSRR